MIRIESKPASFALSHRGLREGGVRRLPDVLGRSDEHERAACECGRQRSAKTASERRKKEPHASQTTPVDTLAFVAADRIESQLKRLPAKPGRLPLPRRRGDVLYVGKAKSLRPAGPLVLPGRLERHAPRHPPDGGRVETIETIVTRTEVEALHLEQNLVKRHRPPFNVRLRDDKSFPYIAVTVEDDYPRVMFTRERHRRGVEYFGPYANAKKVRETLDVLNRVFRYRPVRRAAAGPTQRHPVPRLPHRALPRAVRRLHLEGGLPRADRPGDRVPLGRRPADPPPARGADARGGSRGALRGRRALPQPAARRSSGSRSARRSSGGRSGSIDVIGVAVSPERAAVQVFPLREGRMVDRYSFHLENAAGEELGEVLEQFCLEYYGIGAVDPAADPRAARLGRHVARSQAFLSERRGSQVEVRAPERGEKRRLQELAQQNAELALESETFVRPRRSARAASRRSRSCARRSTSSRCRFASSASTSRTSRARRSSARWSCSRTRVAKKAHYRKFAVRGLDGQDDFAAMREVIARRFARLVGRSRLRGVERVVRRDAEPRRDRRRQGPAVGGARGDAGARPAARRRDLPREADRGGVRSRPAGADPAARSSRPACSSCSASATRRTGSRSRSTASGATLPRARRCSTSSRVSGRRAAARCCSTSARRSASSPRRREELEGVPGVPAKTARSIYAQLHRTGGA